MQQQLEEARQTCTFKPETNRCKSAKKEKDTDGKKLEERLLHEADLRKEKREKLKRE